MSTEAGLAPAGASAQRVLARDLRRGAVAGVAGGAAMAIVLLAAGERSIRQAIALETAAHADEHGETLVSRPVQVVGGVVAVMIFGALVGAVFGVVYAANRARWADPFRAALGLGAVGYLTVVLVPGLKYPANPPGVGDPDTVRARTVAYVTLLAASVLLTLLTRRAADALAAARRVGADARLLLVAGGYVLGVVVLWLAWPASSDPVDAPATLVWRFRITALGGAFALWAVLAAGFGWFAARPARPDRT